jgi:hypothetical protein
MIQRARNAQLLDYGVGPTLASESPRVRLVLSQQRPATSRLPFLTIRVINRHARSKRRKGYPEHQ